MTAPRFAITAIERREWPFTLRMPFRFGVITVTQGRQAVLRVRIRDAAGREAWGVAAESLAAKWFDTDPALSDAQNEDQLRRSLELAGESALAAGMNTAFGHFADGYAAVCFGHSASTSESGRRPRASNRRINQPAALRASDPEK